MPLFALDHNFPEPIVEMLGKFQADAELVPIVDIDDRMPDLDDWQVLVALKHHERPWDGLVTTDSSMLKRPREIATLIRTKLTLVVATEAGHNPVKASGLLFAYIGGICQRTDPETPQIWRLSAANRAAAEPWDFLKMAAEHRTVSVNALFGEASPTQAELDRDPLE